MTYDRVSEKSPSDRLKHFSGLILTSISILIASYVTIHFYYENEKKEIAIEIEKIASEKRNIEYLKLIQQHSKNMFRLRNELDEISFDQGSMQIKNEIIEFKNSLAKELSKTDKLLKKILNSKTESIAATDHQQISFSIISVAHAKTESQNKLTEPNYRLFFALVILTIVFVISIAMLLFSRNEDKIKYSKTIIDGIVGFAIGIASGGSLSS